MRRSGRVETSHTFTNITSAAFGRNSTPFVKCSIFHALPTEFVCLSAANDDAKRSGPIWIPAAHGGQVTIMLLSHERHPGLVLGTFLSWTSFDGVQQRLFMFSQHASAHMSSTR